VRVKRPGLIKGYQKGRRKSPRTSGGGKFKVKAKRPEGRTWRVKGAEFAKGTPKEKRRRATKKKKRLIRGGTRPPKKTIKKKK